MCEGGVGGPAIGSCEIKIGTMPLCYVLWAMALVWEVLKLKNDVQRRVITLMYLWWSERCKVGAAGELLC